MKKEISTELLNFIEIFFGKYDFILNGNTSIENELGITGLDGEEFIKKYSKIFNVDISNFIFSDYFQPEPSMFISSRTVKPLTLGDLETGITQGFIK